mmetsp:Transcript_7293/g.12749  ORF Transcript_7293/g.12749 Transcript_7293/m.12749 type:complete len:122 (-) Transcript_7293:700-1065(-)
MALKRFIRSFEAATAAEVISAPEDEAVVVFSSSDDSSLGTARNPLVNCPALAVMAANSALTEANVSAGISAGEGASSSASELSVEEDTEETLDKEETEETLRGWVSFLKVTFPNSSTAPST